MESSSTYKMLYLLNLLSDEDCTKNQIVKRFQAENITIKKPTINRYINLFIKNGIKITTSLNQNRENVYHFEKNEASLNFSQKELMAIDDIKKLLIVQKKYERIRKTMHLFYKLSRYIKDEEKMERFINFGYFSTINWNLVKQLEKHCASNDIILLDYILPHGGNRAIEIHVDSLRIGEFSHRLYLKGILANGKDFSNLPVDRIFMVKKVIEKNARFDMLVGLLTYIVSKKAYEQSSPDEKESVAKIEGDKVIIERPVDDEFYILQRLSHFCPDIFYISDKRIKELLKEKLEMVRAIYDDEFER